MHRTFFLFTSPINSCPSIPFSPPLHLFLITSLRLLILSSSSASTAPLCVNMSSMFPDDPDSNMDKIQDENALVSGNGNPPSSDNRMLIDSPPADYEEYNGEDEGDIPDYYDDYDDDDDEDDWDDEEYEDDQEMEDQEDNTSTLSEDEELTTKNRCGDV